MDNVHGNAFGFVFLDENNEPTYCRYWGDSLWLFYLHPDKKWVSLRGISHEEMLKLPKNLSYEEQQLYFRAAPDPTVDGACAACNGSGHVAALTGKNFRSWEPCLRCHRTGREPDLMSQCESEKVKS